MGMLALVLAAAPGITWNAPSACPDHQTLTARLHAADVSLEQAVRADVHPPEGPGTSWTLELQVGDAPPRRLEGESCAALTDAVVAMLSIQGPASEPEEPPEPAPPELPPPPPTLPPTAITTPPEAPAPPTAQAEPSAPPRARPDIVLGLAGGIHGVGVPGPGGGLGLTAGVRFAHLRLAAYGQWWFRRTQTVATPVEAAFRLALGGLEACGVGVVRRLHFLGCGTVEGGQLQAEGIAAAPPRTKRHGWAALGGRGGLQWRLAERVQLGPSLGVLAPLNRRRFHVGDASAGQIGPVELRGLVHLEVVLPGRRKNRDAR